MAEEDGAESIAHRFLSAAVKVKKALLFMDENVQYKNIFLKNKNPLGNSNLNKMVLI